jgi:predicted O-methyltransferase YrrM
MLLGMSARSEVPDPTSLYRIRDGVYAGDLLIAAVVDLDLFSWLADHGPTSAADLAAGLHLAHRPTDVLLTYCASLHLIVRDVGDGDRVAITDLARHHLVAGSTHDLRPYYRSLAERPAVAELARVLRDDSPAAWASAASRTTATTDLPGDWSGRLTDADFASRITAAMDARGAFLGPAMATALDGIPIKALLDVAGSSGIYACAVLDRRPTARAAVFERTPVDAAARALLQDRGWSHRVQVLTGDMFHDALPLGYDLHLYSHVFHDWDASRVAQLFRASYDALPAGGWLIDHDTHVDSDKCGPRSVAEYSVLLMHSTPGKCWSIGELTDLAHSVGFTHVTHRPTAGDRSVLLAHKPDAPDSSPT